MARKSSRQKVNKTVQTNTVRRGRSKKVVEEPSYLDRIETEIRSSHSRLSMVLGALIILVIGILVFNYFNRSKPEIGPSSQTAQQQTEQSDVSPDNLPGKYTVKDGDTLFTVAEKYYQNGDLFTEIAKANQLDNPDLITTGQVLNIPKITPAPTLTTTPQPTETSNPDSNQQSTSNTEWGVAITGDTYTVTAGDWLSKISGRAYGDIHAYQRIVQANNISDPDLIEPGTVLKIPRG